MTIARHSDIYSLALLYTASAIPANQFSQEESIRLQEQVLDSDRTIVAFRIFVHLNA